MPSRPMPVSSLKWTRARRLSFVAADEMSFAPSSPVTGSVTPARTMPSTSSGSTLERICTSASRTPAALSAAASSSAS